MIYILNKSTDPYFNLAAEEYFLKNFSDEIVMLWQNHKTIVVGKNQNTIEEINTDYVRENDIKVVRRLTGGGAVYHDDGNVNYTFIVNDGEKITDFAYFTQPIINALSELGTIAELKGRNDLLIGDKKISGNAQCAWKSRVMHHGTLLFDSDLSVLSSALKVKPGKIESKGIKSVSSRVTNIASLINQSLTARQFIKHIEQCLFKNDDSILKYDMTREDIEAIKKLRDEKYSTWEWNFGYSPKYDFTKDVKFNGGMATIGLHVEDGIIKKLAINGDYFGSMDTEELAAKLIGLKHEYETVLERVKELAVEQYIWGMDAVTFTEAMF